MTGPEHYRKAEQLLAKAAECSRPDDELSDEDAMALITVTTATAQVHATLALAASFAEVNPTSTWHEVAGGAS